MPVLNATKSMVIGEKIDMLDLEYQRILDSIKNIKTRSRHENKERLKDKRKLHRARLAQNAERNVQLGIALGVMTTNGGVA